MQGDENNEPLPGRIPVFPLSRTILLPGCSLPLNIFEPRYLAMVKDALATHRIIGMVQPVSEIQGLDTRVKPEIWPVGGAGRIVRAAETDDKRIIIELKGLCRFRAAEELSVTTPYRQVVADWTAFEDDLTESEAPILADRTPLIKAFSAYIDAKGLSANIDAIASAPDRVLVNTLSMIIPMACREKQALMESADITKRAEMLAALLTMAAAHSERHPENDIN